MSGKDYFGVTPLMQAVLDENRETIELLLTSGMDVNEGDNEGRTALMHAAKNGKNFSVEMLLSHGADVKKRDNKGYDALYYSLDAKNPEIVKMLLKAGADPSAKAEKGLTTFMQAVKYISGEILDTLNSGPFLNDKDDYGLTPLMHAVDCSNIGAVRWLLKNGADVNAVDEEDRTALFFLHAKKAVSVEIADMLIKAGIDISKRAKNENTAFLWASGYTNFPDLLKLFLDAGSDVNDIGQSRQNALLRAIENGQPKPILELLLDAGADTCIKDYYNQDALTKLASGRAYKNKEELKDLIVFLRSKGAKTEFSDKEFRSLCMTGSNEQIIAALEDGANANYYDYDTPILNVVMRNKSLDLVKAFVKHGAELAKGSREGVTLLMAAAAIGTVEIVKFLLEGDPSICADTSSMYEVDNNGQSAFMHAAMAGYPSAKIMDYLLTQGADIEEKDHRYGRTALNWAAFKDCKDCVKLLIEKGANVNALEKDGTNPLLNVVILSANPEIVELLLKAGAEVGIKGRYGYEAVEYSKESAKEDLLKLFTKYGVMHKENPPVSEKEAAASAMVEIGELLVKGKPQEIEKALNNIANFSVASEVNGVPAAVIVARDNPYPQSLDLFLKRKADLSLSYDGKTAKEYALMRGAAFARVLEKYGCCS